MKAITTEEHIKQTQASLASDSCRTSHVLENVAVEFPKPPFFSLSPDDIASAHTGEDMERDRSNKCTHGQGCNVAYHIFILFYLAFLHVLFRLFENFPVYWYRSFIFHKVKQGTGQH